MKLTLAEPKYLKDSISIISDLVTEVQFRLSKDGMELVAMDPANVAMVIFKLLSSAFVEYEVENEQILAVNLSTLKQILRRASASDTITISMEGEGKLKLNFKGVSSRTFSLPIMEAQEKEQRIPDLKFPIFVEMSSSAFNEAIEDVDIVSDSVTLMVEPKHFRIMAEGDISDASIEIKQSETVVIGSAKDPIKAKYSVEYLKKIIQGSKISDRVKIQFNSDYPLRIDYKAIDKVSLSFILAPRVDND